MQRTNAIESLESRQLLASISGLVWNDLDKSNTRDEGELRQPNVTVFLDNNHNARLDVGEPRTLTDASGIYTFSNLKAGTYDVVAVPPKNQAQTSPGYTGAIQKAFNITLNYLSAFTSSQTRAFEQAVRRWEAIIIGDLPDVSTDSGPVDDVMIDVSQFDIDGESNTLAQGDAVEKRRNTFLPSRGVIELDSSDIDDLELEGKLVETITHEIAHVLGFGTIWEDKGLISGASGSSPRFTGPLATAAYNKLFVTSAAGVPLATDSGEGTDLSHWRESTFTIEQMTGFSEDVGVFEPISVVTVQQFADLGYTVDPNASDFFKPGTRSAARWTPASAGVPAFTTRVTVATNDSQDDIDFGNRANRAPSIKPLAISATTATRGTVLALSTRSADADDDAILGVAFYRESNGVAGLQVGSDTFISNKSSPRRGIYTVTTATDGLTPGVATYYAVSSDEFLSTATVAANVTIVGPPERPGALAIAPKSTSSAQIGWRDRSNNETYFRIEVSTQSKFIDSSLIRRFNVAANARAIKIGSLTPGVTYFYRIRAFNTLGGSAWTYSTGVKQPNA